ncbi:MAG: IPT/TIG domain-containing protein [Pirellulaceae bacterium]
MTFTTQQPATSIGTARRQHPTVFAHTMLVATLCINHVLYAEDRPDYRPFLHQLTPSVASRGEVLTIIGEGFGAQQGNQQVFYSRKIDGHIRRGRETMRVISWSDTTVRVQVPLLPAQADSYVLYVTPPNRDAFTNTRSFSGGSQRLPLRRAGTYRAPTWIASTLIRRIPGMK